MTTPPTAGILGTLNVRSPDELLAAIPHVLGFTPAESIILFPFAPGLPVSRMDLPRTAQDRAEVWDALSGPYGRLSRPGTRVAIVCVTEDRRSAELASRHIAEALGTLGIATGLRLWADDRGWCDLDIGTTGPRTQTAVDQMAARAAFRGAVQPAPSREAMAASLVGDREPMVAALPAAEAQVRDPRTERDWALARLAQFHADGFRLSDIDGARLLVSLRTVSTRDALWQDMSAQNAASHIALWTDLTRRAPDEVRAAPAAMLGFASWLNGQGARAWCALDQVPVGPPYPMAAVVAVTVQNGIHPREWELLRDQLRELAAELDESFVPEGPARDRHEGHPVRPLGRSRTGMPR